MNKKIIYASLINDLFKFNNDWLYNVLRDGVYEKRNTENKEVIRYSLNKNNIEDVIIFSNNFMETKHSLDKFYDLGYNIKPVQNLSMLDRIYEPAFDFQEQNKSLKYVHRITNEKLKSRGINERVNIDICYTSCFISDLIKYDDHIKTMKFIGIFSLDYVDRIYIDFNTSNYLRNRKTYKGREFTREEKDRFLKDVREITKKEVIEKKSMKDLEEYEYDLGEYDFCFSNDTTSEGFKTFKNRRLKQRLHIPSSRSLILGVRTGEKIINKEI